MTNHPNRSAGNPGATPTPTAIKEAREAAGLTQTAAAALIHSSLRTWQQWEADDRRMHPGLFELFLIKSTHPSFTIECTADTPVFGAALPTLPIITAVRSIKVTTNKEVKSAVNQMNRELSAMEKVEAQATG